METQTTEQPAAKTPRKRAPRKPRNAAAPTRNQIEQIIAKAKQVEATEGTARRILAAAAGSEDAPGIVHAIISKGEGAADIATIVELFAMDDFTKTATILGQPDRIKGLWKIAQAAGLVDGNQPNALPAASIALARGIAERADRHAPVRHAHAIAQG